MRINNLSNIYKVSFGGYHYYTDATSKYHAKIKIYNQAKKTEPTFIEDKIINIGDMTVKELFK